MFFFCQGFLSQTLRTHETYLSIQACICNFVCEMTTLYFFAPPVIIRLLLNEMCHLENHHWWTVNFCLIDDLTLDLLKQFYARKRWFWTCIEYYLIVTGEPTSLLWLSFQIILDLNLSKYIVHVFMYFENET